MEDTKEIEQEIKGEKIAEQQQQENPVQIAINRELAFAEETTIRTLRNCAVNIINIMSQQHKK